MADCKEVFFTGSYSYNIFKANRLTFITVTFPMMDYYFIGPLKAVTINAINIATVVPEAFCSKSPYFHLL
jgi:hypothetical protein